MISLIHVVNFVFVVFVVMISLQCSHFFFVLQILFAFVFSVASGCFGSTFNSFALAQQVGKVHIFLLRKTSQKFAIRICRNFCNDEIDVGVLLIK